jgi:hypothetical protein
MPYLNKVRKQEEYMPSQFEKEKAKKNIALILDKVRTEADPLLLNKYRSLFNKEVSLFSGNRSWAAAYLLMLYDQGELGRADRNRPRKFENRDRFGEGRSSREGRAQQEKNYAADSRPSQEHTAQEKVYPLAEEDSRRLFLSIGRNRRVFPREILGLINTKTAIPRENIGAIRILDNYSFVQVRDTVADTIIEALNGQMFRGRTLTVNYARARKDEGDDTSAGFEETDSKENNIEDTVYDDTKNQNDVEENQSLGQPESQPDGSSEQDKDYSNKEDV